MAPLSVGARRARSVRIDDDVAGDRAHVLARQVAAGIAVVHQPVLAVDVAHEDHHVMIAYGRHAGGGLGPWKLLRPGGGEIELAADFAEHVPRGLTAAEFVRAAGGPAADDNRVAVGIDRAHRSVGIACGGLMPRRGRGAVGTAAQVADDRVMRRGAAMVMRGAGRSIAGRCDQADKDRCDENGCGFYQFNLAALERLAAAETAPSGGVAIHAQRWAFIGARGA